MMVVLVRNTVTTILGVFITVKLNSVMATIFSESQPYNDVFLAGSNGRPTLGKANTITHKFNRNDSNCILKHLTLSIFVYLFVTAS